MSGKLIVSCQALEDEPLHSSYIMAKMALAASQGGASGIRANSVADIRAIKEVRALYAEGVDVIAFDSTYRIRPNNRTFEEFIKDIKEQFRDQKIMADVSTVYEAKIAESYGVDFVATTLVSYTPYTKGDDPF